KPDTWDALYPQLLAEGIDSSRVNYQYWFHAGGPLSFYIGQVANEARYLLDFERIQGLAATRVDVVGHSMGGLLTRLDAVNPNFKVLGNNFGGYFRRIITIDTPHFGSRAATVLLDLVQHCPIELKGPLE